MEAPIVAGVAAVPVRRQLGCTARDAAAEVALEAIADAGIEPRDVDALFVSPPGFTGPPGFMWSCALAHHLGLRTRAQALIECGGTTALLAMTAACDAVRLGRAERALVVAIDQRTPDMPPDLEHVLKSSVVGLVGLYGPHDAVYGLGAPIPYYAMSAQRYMHERGASPEDLAQVAVALRTLAEEHPRAQFRERIGIDDVLASPMLCPPLHLLECSSLSSGAAAVVVARADALPVGAKRPVRVIGVGEHHEPDLFGPARGPLTSFAAARRAASSAFAQAGRRPDDIDVAEVYGVFSATELILYEDLGLVPAGDAIHAVREGRTSGAGRTLFNPSGGRLSMGHPAGATPLYSVVEVVEQLRGTARGRQAANASLGFVHAEHGMIDGSLVAILEGA